MSGEKLAFLLTWGLALHQSLCADFVKVAYQPSNVLLDYAAYRHISIVRFRVPEDTIAALFKFTAREEKIGGIGSCAPYNVSVYLKSGTIPLVNPDGSKTAAKLLKDRRKHYSLPMASTGDQYLMTVSTPAPDYWYAIAFRSWTDPDTEQITQQGLGASCSTVLEAELFVELTAVSRALIVERDERFVQLTKARDSAIAQFFMEDYSEPANISLSSSCGGDCLVAATVTTTEPVGGVLMNDTTAYLPFGPYINSFHRLTLQLISGEASNVSYILPGVNGDHVDSVRHVSLMRKSLPDFFLFDYEHVIDNSTKSQPVNLTADVITALSFEVGPVSDIGGTLSVGTKLVNNDRKDLIVFGCISLGYYSSITAGGGCIKKRSTTAPDLFSRSTEPSMIHAPYPEPGTWYLTLKAFTITSPCNCSETCRTSACVDCSCLAVTSGSVEISVGSSSCVEGRCSSNGRCVNYMKSGFVYSACYCTGGYRGFDCADDAYVLTGGGILVRLLMLTLSNLAFVSSIYVAVKREYYTEAIVYTAVMLFSTLYHACEAGEDAYNLCVTKVSVLQFCDFFNALLSIWVTLVAMASFGPRLTGFFQVIGAIIIALGSELDRTALWVFLLPAVTGCILLCASWGSRCKARRSLRYPSHPYRNVQLPAGLLLVILGLVCYAFLQTRRNYHVIHSLWHICVAVGVVLLLPSKRYMK